MVLPNTRAVFARCHRLRRFALASVLATHLASSAHIPIDWSSPVEIASGRGVRGEWRQNESNYDHVDDGTPAMQPDGSVAVAWVDQKQKDVLFQLVGPNRAKRFAEPVNVSRTPAVFSWLPRIAISPERPRDVFIAWQEIVFSGASHGGDICFARSTDGGATFEPPINVSHSFGGDGKGRIHKDHWQNGSFDLALGPNGLVCLGWTEYDGPLWFSRSTDRGVSFSAPQRIAGSSTEPARAPSLAIDGDGRIYLAWTTGENSAADIRLTRSGDGGEHFEPAGVVHRTPHYSDAPKIAVDARGRLHLVYGETVGGPFARARIHYARSTNRGDSFSAPRDISAPLPKGGTSARYPSIAIGGDGALFVSWEHYPEAHDASRGLGYASSADGGRSFSRPALIPQSVDPARGTNGSHQGLLMRKLSANARAHIAVVNSSLKPGDHSRVWLILGQAPGSHQNPSLGQASARPRATDDRHHAASA